MRQLTFKDDGCCYCVGFDPMPKCSCWCHTPDERETDMPETFIDYEDGAPRTPDYTRTETRRYVVVDETRRNPDGYGDYFVWPNDATLAPGRTIIIPPMPTPDYNSIPMVVPWDWASQVMLSVANFDFDHPVRQHVTAIVADVLSEYRS